MSRADPKLLWFAIHAPAAGFRHNAAATMAPDAGIDPARAAPDTQIQRRDTSRTGCSGDDFFPVDLAWLERAPEQRSAPAFSGCRNGRGLDGGG